MKALELLHNYLDVAITMDDPTEDIDEAIKELEELETKDRLAELEKVILDYYLAKGVSIWCWWLVIYNKYFYFI